MDGSTPDHASPYEIHWENPAISPHQLNSSNILQYFCHLSNPFYDRECNNEVVRMQGLSQDKLTTLRGTEFYLYRYQVGQYRLFALSWVGRGLVVLFSLYVLGSRLQLF